MSVYSVALEKKIKELVEAKNTSFGKIFSLIEKSLAERRTRSVLDVGSSTGYFGQYLKNKLGASVWGIEINKEDARKAKKVLDKVIVSDVEVLDFKKCFGKKKFDVIIFADVLEHLKDPGKVLKKIKSILKPNGQVIASIPNVTHQSVKIQLLVNQWNYEDLGLLDKTHLRFFDYRGTVKLFENSGFYIRKIDYTVADIPQVVMKKILAKVGVELTDQLEKLLYLPEAKVYQYIILATKNKPSEYKSYAKRQSIINPVAEWSRSWQEVLEALDQRSKRIEELQKENDRKERRLRKRIERLQKELLSTKEAFFRQKLRLKFQRNRLQEMKSLLSQKTEKIKGLSKENRDLAAKVDNLNRHISNLNQILDNITSAKTFKVWQAFVKVRDKLKSNPLVIFKGLKILITKGPLEFKKKSVGVQEREIKINEVNQQYQIWLQKHSPTEEELERQRKRQKRFKYRPKISIITPVYNTEEKWLRACIESVLNQTYDNWELCLADDASTKPHVKRALEEYRKKDERIKVVYRRKNGHISRASNSALKLATGEFIALLDHDDELAPHALFKVVELLNKHPDANFIYSDEDKLELDGRRVDPFFKPDWSPDMFLSTNYLCHLSVIRKKLVDQVGGFRPGYEGSQDYDLFLRVTEKTDKIYHIPDILYSWRKVPGSTAAVYEVKSYANEASIKALKNALRRRKIRATVGSGLVPGSFRVKYKIIGKPLVSIIIPTKDKVEYLRRCVQSVLGKTSYNNYELLIVDTGSTEQETLDYYKELRKSSKIRFLKWDRPFNFASVNNFAVKKAKGKYVLLLNNDTEVITPDWIEVMLEHAQRREVGAVGAKLLYPDGRIQHAGIILGIRGGPIEKGIAGHAQKLFEDAPMGLPLWNSKDIIRNFSAVTAACLMTDKRKYLEVDGMDEKFRIAFNDVDFCLKLIKKGYLNVYTPYAKLYHYESVSVGRPDQGTRDIAEFQKEINMMHRRWGNLLQNDPYYNPNLTLDREDFSLKV